MSSGTASQRDLLKTLTDHGVELVLIGGHAVAAHGLERATGDVDIVFSSSPENVARFAKALRSVDASIVFADIPSPAEGITSEWLASGGHFKFATNFGALDALTWVAGLGYDELASEATTAELVGGLRISVCSYEHLIQMKSTGGRLRDQADLERLRELRDEPRSDRGDNPQSDQS